MSEKTAALLESVESLVPGERLEFVNAVFRRLGPIDSGVLDDDDVAAGGDAIAALLDQEENATKTG